MMWFHYTAVDASGNESRGNMEATSESEVREQLAAQGLKPTYVAPATRALRGFSDPAMDINAAGTRGQGSGVSPQGHRGRGGLLALILASVALVVALFALGWTLLRDPLGGGLKKYDFSTPKAALTSDLQIQVNGDVRAMIERTAQERGLEERLRTLTVHREKKWQNKVYLFISFSQDGKKKYTVEVLEKSKKTGNWKQSFSSRFPADKDNKELAEEIRRWEKRTAEAKEEDEDD